MTDSRAKCASVATNPKTNYSSSFQAFSLTSFSLSSKYFPTLHISSRALTATLLRTFFVLLCIIWGFDVVPAQPFVASHAKDICDSVHSRPAAR